jgi:hypothetical protein
LFTFEASTSDSPPLTPILDVHDVKVSVTGSGPDVEAAMESLKIRPGDHNGEDITIDVTITAIESNPSEQGPNEIAKATVEVSETFVLPIDPVIQGVPTLTVPNPSVSGLEDTNIALGTLVVGLDGVADADGSEEYYIEIQKASYPQTTKFYVDGVQQSGTLLDDGWLRLPDSGNALIEIKPPKDFSGLRQLNFRGRIIDFTMSGTAAKVTSPQTIEISVSPDADDITYPDDSVGVEDMGPVGFGAKLATTGIQPSDNGAGTGNNEESETISQIQFVVPADTDDLTYTISTISGDYAPSAAGVVDGVGTAQVSFDTERRTYNITSSIITDSSDVASVAQVQRELAEQHIRDTLATFQVEMGPTHTDLNGVITVTATTLDVNIGEFSKQDNEFNHKIIIQAVADVANVFVHDADPAYEDTPSIPLHINATRSADEDNSETVSVRITVPRDPVVLIGTIGGQTPDDMALTDQGNGVYLIEAQGDTPAERESLLNSFVAGGGLTFNPRQNWAGNDTLKVEVISTESATGGELAGAEYGGADGTAATETVIEWITIVVLPIADNPTVAVKANSIGMEDTRISVPVSVTLMDSDGSETYVMEISASSVPVGAELFGVDDTTALSMSDGVYTLQPADIDSLHIQPPEHWSSALQEDITLVTTTIVTDTTLMGQNIATLVYSVPVKIIGVADKPGSRSIHVVATEDVDYPIGASVGDLSGILVDTDGSESMSLILEGLPPGAPIAKTEAAAGLSYLGNGKWLIPEESIQTLTVTPKPNFLGENPYPDLVCRVISQEMYPDLDQSESDDWPITIDVYPVADGFSMWDPSDKASEEENEVSGRSIRLSKAGNYTLGDEDGSQSVVEFYFALSSLIANAGIGKRLDDLTGDSALLSLENRLGSD